VAQLLARLEAREHIVTVARDILVDAHRWLRRGGL